MNSSIQVFKAERLFTGTGWLMKQAVVVSQGKILDVVAADTVSGEYVSSHPIIAPAFIDIQIYGADERLLAVYPEADSLHRLYKYCSNGGASHFQPTVATNSYEVFFRAIDAVKAYWNEGGKGCLGLHIEGPWINPRKKGAHLEAFIHAPSAEQAKELLEYGKDVITMITLAPEVCSREVIELVRSYGVIISAGHSDATYEEATAAFDAGITTATHLFNAMSPLQHRAPGMAGAIFNHTKVMASIVPDGYHVDFAAIEIARKILKQRLFVITDAVTETSNGGYAHHLRGDRYESNGILSGSALTMASSLRNLIAHTHTEPAEALRMVSLYPAQVMGKAGTMGKIEKGYDANLVMLDEGWEVKGMTSVN
ncbi:MAG: nagA [Sediminibacterium sp.]|nr:nagA [Sediminibacterium sp.]